MLTPHGLCPISARPSCQPCQVQVIAFGPITGVVASGILYGIPTNHGLVIGNRLKKAATWVRSCGAPPLVDADRLALTVAPCYPTLCMSSSACRCAPTTLRVRKGPSEASAILCPPWASLTLTMRLAGTVLRHHGVLVPHHPHHAGHASPRRPAQDNASTEGPEEGVHLFHFRADACMAHTSLKRCLLWMPHPQASHANAARCFGLSAVLHVA